MIGETPPLGEDAEKFRTTYQSDLTLDVKHDFIPELYYKVREQPRRQLQHLGCPLHDGNILDSHSSALMELLSLSWHEARRAISCVDWASLARSCRPGIETWTGKGDFTA